MSTKAIEEALDRLRQLERRGDEEFYRIDAAEKELEAIRKAAKVLSAYATPNNRETGLALGLMDNIAKEET